MGKLALPENLDSVPSVHMAAYSLLTPAPGDLTASSDFGTQTYMQVKYPHT
jgi:hypothetical protein